MNALMKVPLEQFRNKASRFSRSECFSVLRDIKDTKRTFGRTMTDEQISDIERKETIITRQLRDIGVVGRDNRQEFTDFMHKERNRR